MADTPASFQDWYDASKQLTESIQRYLDASLALETVVTCRSGNGLDTSTLDKLFDAVRPELVSRGSRNDKLKRSDAALCRVHNQSTKFVPAQRLPCELLVRIFSLACQRCGFFPSSKPKISNCQTTKTILAITHVCADWRRLAINTPMLWSHVDVFDSSSDFIIPGHEKPWLERAHSAPLSVQANITSRSDSKLFLLGPHFSAIRSLGFQSDDPGLLRKAVAYWISDGTPGSVQELSLIGPKKINAFEDSPRMAEFLDLSFVDPLRVLRLRHVDLKIFNHYKGLVHLELSHLALYSDPLEYFVACRLARCPGLRVLKLDTIRLSREPAPSFVKFIKLDMLERLEIINLSPDPCSRLLPLLVPGPGELSLRLEAEVNPENKDALISFLNRSNVTRLYFKFVGTNALQTDWMAAIPNLQMLTLDFDAESRYEFRGSVLESLIPPETSTSWFPKLRTLWIIDYDYDDGVLKRVVETRCIESLIISVFQHLDTRSLKQQLARHLKRLIMEYALHDSVVAEWYSRTE